MEARHWGSSTTLLRFKGPNFWVWKITQISHHDVFFGGGWVWTFIRNKKQVMPIFHIKEWEDHVTISSFQVSLLWRLLGCFGIEECFFNVSFFPISSNSQRSLALNLQPSWSRSTRPTWRVSYGHHHALTNFPRPWRWMKPFEKSLRFSVSWSKGLVFFVVARKGSWRYFYISRRCMRESLKRWLFSVERLQKSHLSKKLCFFVVGFFLRGCSIPSLDQVWGQGFTQNNDGLHD